MAFVHSLVKTKRGGKTGWRAPVELGESAPHYVGFVVPLGKKTGTLEKYTCELVRHGKGNTQSLIEGEMVRFGEDAFFLTAGKTTIWFAVRPVQKNRGLPYVGALRHPDFASTFVEIEPADPAELDRLYEDKSLIIIGCDPAHYSSSKKARPLVKRGARKGKPQESRR